MARPALRLTLAKKDRKTLQALLTGGFQPVRVVLHALALQWLDGGETASQIAARLPLTAQTVRNIRHRYQDGGLNRALHDRPRPGARPVLNDALRQRLVAMVCSTPPEGAERWTVRLVAEEAVKRKMLPGIGRETVRLLLQHHDLKPWREKNVVRGRGEPSLRGADGRRAGNL